MKSISLWRLFLFTLALPGALACSRAGKVSKTAAGASPPEAATASGLISPGGGGAGALGGGTVLVIPLPQSAMPPNLQVSTSWLAVHLEDPQVKILHIGHDRAAYQAGHIPGAQFVADEELVPPAADGGAQELPPLRSLIALARRLGLERGDRIVVYDDSGGLEAVRAWQAMARLGMGERTAFLDGFLRQWQAEGRPLSGETPVVQPSRFVPPAQNAILTAY